MVVNGTLSLFELAKKVKKDEILVRMAIGSLVFQDKIKLSKTERTNYDVSLTEKR